MLQLFGYFKLHVWLSWELHSQIFLFWDLLGLFRSAYGQRLHYFCKSSKHCFSYYSRYYECGWKQHVYNGNQPELKSCQKNAVFTPTKIKKYRKWEVEFHGFDGFTYVDKTGRCVNNTDIKGADMDHCRGLFADGMEYWTPSGERFFSFSCKSKLENLYLYNEKKLVMV